MAAESKNTGLLVGGVVLTFVGAILLSRGVVTGEGGWLDVQSWIAYVLDIAGVALIAKGGAPAARPLHALGGLLCCLGFSPWWFMLATPESTVGLIGLGGGAVALLAGLGLVFAGDKLKK